MLARWRLCICHNIQHDIRARDRAYGVHRYCFNTIFIAKQLADAKTESYIITCISFSILSTLLPSIIVTYLNGCVIMFLPHLNKVACFTQNSVCDKTTYFKLHHQQPFDRVATAVLKASTRLAVSESITRVKTYKHYLFVINCTL